MIIYNCLLQLPVVQMRKVLVVLGVMNVGGFLPCLLLKYLETKFYQFVGRGGTKVTLGLPRAEIVEKAFNSPLTL